MANPDVQIADVEKNQRETVRIALREWKGHRFIDCRVMAQNRDGELVFTPKGFGIAPELIGQLIDGLQKAQAEATRRGLI